MRKPIKPTRRLILLTVVLPVAVAGLIAAVVLAPGSIEGVYNPLAISSTMGCDCDQFEEFREGRVVFHVMGSESFMNIYYENDASGSVFVRVRPEKSGEVGKLLARAEPHLLGTLFHYPHSGKSEWAWKRFVSRKMKDHMAGAKIIGMVREEGGERFFTWDSKFNVLRSTFYPYRKASPATTPTP